MHTERKEKPFQSSLTYGGTLLRTRYGRSRPRPLSTRHSLHLVMRSTKARGAWSFQKDRNQKNVREIIHKFAQKHSVKIVSLAVNFNHLHLHIRLPNLAGYKPFIRAISAAITMAVTGASRWKPLKKSAKDRFWDYRPFTRLVIGERAFRRVENYIEINCLEAVGWTRQEARSILAWNSS